MSAKRFKRKWELQAQLDQRDQVRGEHPTSNEISAAHSQQEAGRALIPRLEPGAASNEAALGANIAGAVEDAAAPAPPM
jgi:hypothetical protein